MEIMKKFLKVMLVSFITLTSVINVDVSYAAEKSADVLEERADTNVYAVQEDAYLRSGSNANRNYNFEEIGKAHGAQYEGKGIKVISARGHDIIGLMKFTLPTKEEVQNNKLNSFELEFSVFKNPGYDLMDQTYYVNYSTDTSWNEATVTWNNRPSDIKEKDAGNRLASFEVKKGIEYEKETDANKIIRIDITQGILNLINEGHTEITVYLTAQTATNNSSIMIYSKETSNQDQIAKIKATSFSKNDLKILIDECSALNSGDYTQDSFKKLTAAMNLAQEVYDNQTATDEQIIAAYNELMNARNALVSSQDPDDANNVAFMKPTRSNLSKDQTVRVNDGNYESNWSGKFFPSYVDIDLMDTYAIDDIELSFPKDKVIYYTLYGSNDGKNYDELYQSRSNDKKTEQPDIITFNTAKNYRIVRVYLEYTQNESKAYLSEVKVHGKKSDTNTGELRKGTFEEITKLKDFDDTDYAKPITTAETVENVYGIIDRIIGSEYRSWFTFEIANNTANTNDYFELSDKGGKVHIKANNGINLATGLNYYFKNYAKIQVSEQTISGKMPEKIVPVGKTVRKETPMKVRYAFNYCTLSYTFAFFGEEEWQRENDWLALNGVNVVLDLAGQEATWIKFLMNYGYSFDDAKDWLVGPGYIAWQYMDNMEVFGGPLPDGYIIDRVELARKTQRWKRSLGMETVLQGYAGMVPTDFNTYQPDVVTIAQGNWNGFSRPTMIGTDSDDYDQMARDFYEAQRFVYGETSDYYAVDPFHEGGKRPAGLTDDIISREVLESMLEYDSNAVWTVQGWQSNPTSDLLKGMGENREDHVLIVDLIKYPLVSSGEAQYKKDEFQGTSWAWCLLGNFGGNPTMNGEIQTMVNEILDAKKNSNHLKGIGIISEATYDNPMIYDLIFDLAWVDESFNLNQWINQYIELRYGGTSSNVKEAWQLIKNANYNEGVRLTSELFGVRTGGVPSKIGKKKIGYTISDLENALRLLLEDYDKFKDSEGYRYDLSEIMRQVVSNYALYKYHSVIDARDAKDLEAFRKEKAEFLNAFDVLNEVSKTQQDQLGGEWIGKAQDRAANYDDFSRSTFEMNAKSLITTWGSVGGALIDYGFRTYEGMFLDIRKSNWVEYLDQVEQNLINGSPITTPTSGAGYAHKYWRWVIGDQVYTRDAADSPSEILAVANRVLDECVFAGELDPNIGNVALNRKAIINKNESYDGAKFVTDGDSETLVKIAENPEVIVDLLAEFDLSKIQVICNRNADKMEVYTSVDAAEWEKVNTTSTSDNVFEGVEATGRYVMVKFLDSEVELNEIRVYGDKMLPNLEQLQRLVEEAENLDTSVGTNEQIDTFNKTLATAKKAIEEAAAPDTVNVVYWELYDAMAVFNTYKDINIAVGKPVKAHNDPAGNSKRINDGDIASSWNGGRLSATGKPYEETITPGWVVIDLDGLYDINQINVLFGNENIWHQYEIYTSLDGDNWDKVGEKKTQTVPNEKEDQYELDKKRARYVALYATNIQVGSDSKRMTYSVTEFQVYGKKVNKDALNKAIQSAKEKVENEYTVDSWKTLVDELAKAEAIAANDLASQSDINEAASQLKQAIDLLAERANVAELNTLIQECLKLNKDDYTKDSWDKFTEALENAKNIVADNSNITQSQADEVYDLLVEAKKSLKEATDKSALDNAIKEAEKLDSSKYTKESWEQLQKALDNARTVYANEKATQKEADSALNNLKKAYNSLVMKPNPDQPETPDETDKTYVKDEVTINTKTDLGDVKLMVKHYSNEMLQAIKAEIKDKDLLSNYTIEKLLDVYFVDETGNRIVLDKAVDMNISIKLDAEMLGKKLYIVYIADDGKVTFLPSTVSNGAIQFKTTHNSKYAIVSKAAITSDETIKPNTPIKNTGASAANESVAVVFTTIIVLASVSLFINRKKKEN